MPQVPERPGIYKDLASEDKTVDKMVVSVISVVATLAAIALGAPQNGYLYPPAEVDFALIPEETNLEEQEFLPAGDENIIFPDADGEESSATTDHQSHAGDHDHDHQHDHHHDHHHLGLEWLREAVPGEPGVDYPIYWQAPRTSFNCRLYQEGYYADMETGCQVFHVCNNIGDRTFLCPNGTIFNQEHFTCQWWFNVDCSRAQNFYELNINIGTVALETSRTPAVKGAGQRKQPRQPVPGVTFENAQEPAQRSEDVPRESIQEGNIPQTEQQDLIVGEILPFINNENQPSVYVTEQGPLGGEQETEPVTEIPIEYISGQDEIDQSLPREETDVATQELEYPSVQIVSDFPSEDQIPENQVILTETNINPEQEETIIVQSQNEDSLNFPQETIINEQDLDYSTIQDSGVYPVQQQTETPITQQETIYDIIPEEISTTDFQQEVNVIPTQQDNEVVSVSIQQQNDTIGNAIVTDFALVQQENDFVAVENSQQEGNTVLGEQESGVFIPQSETSSASEQDFTTAQQEIALLPTQEGQVLVPVQYESNEVPDQQGLDFSAGQEIVDAFTITLDELAEDLLPVEQGASIVPNQVEYHDDDKKGYTTVQEEAGFLLTEKPVLIPELPVSYIGQGQEEESFSLVPQEVIPSSEDQEPKTFPIYHVSEHHEAGSSVTQGESDFIPSNQERDSISLKDGTTFSVHHENNYDTTVKPASESVSVYQESVSKHHEAGSSVTQGVSDIIPFNQEIDSTSLQEGTTFSVHHENNYDTTVKPASESVSVYQESVSEHHEAGSFITQGVSDFIPFNQEIDSTSLQDGTTFSVHHENDYETTIKPASESVLVYQESELNDVQQDTGLLQVQPVTSHSPVPQDAGEFTENEGLPVQQGETSADSLQQDTGFIPEEEQVTVLPNQHVFDNAFNQQQGHIFQENDILPPFQVNTGMSIHESADHVSPQHELEIDTVTEGGEYYSSQQDITENIVDHQKIGVTSFDQHETNFPTVGDSQFSTFQQETSRPNVDPVSTQSHVEQSVNVEISTHDVGYVPEEYEGSYSPVQIDIPVIQPQQEYSFIPGQQEVSYNAGQQYPTHTLEQHGTDQVSYQQTNEQNFISQGFGSDSTFVQDDIELDFVPQEQSYGFVQENQDYAPENHENVHEISQLEEGLFPGKHILTEVPVQEEPVYVDIQEENVFEDNFEINGGHINEPSAQLPVELNPVAVTSNLPKVVPEVLPEADSTYGSPSAIIPEIPVLYGVPLHSSLPDIEDGSAFEILLPSEVREEVTGEDNLIAPGVSQVGQDDKSSQIFGESITTFPGSFAQEPMHEVIQEQFHHEDHGDALYPVLQEQEYPQSYQLNEESLDVTELDQVEPVTEALAIPNLFQFPEEVDIRRTVVNEENMAINTHTNDDHQAEYIFTTIIPILFEDITEANYFKDDSAVGINREISGHFEISEDNLVTAKSHNADNEEEIYEVATEIPSLATYNDGDQLTLEPIETDTSYAEHKNSLHSELPQDSFATELSTFAEVDTEKEPEWLLEPYHTTVSSLYESESLLGSETPKEIKESNHTVNATNVSAQDVEVQSQAIQEKIEHFLESQENSHEEDDSQEQVTVFPALLNEIKTTHHEDPVLSLVYKATATPLSKNQDTTLAPYTQQEDKTVFPREKEEVAEEERANVIPREDEAFERTVVTTISPVELDFATLPFAEAEEENKIHSFDEENKEGKFPSFPQLVDLDKLFGIPPEEKYEARNEVQQFTLFGTDEATQRSQTLYKTPDLPVVDRPSNQYLPPF